MASLFAFACRAWPAVLVASCGGGVFTSASSDGGDGDSTVTDGGADAGPSWCKTDGGDASFCEDFDEYTDVAALGHAWTQFTMQGGTLSFTPLAATPSPPNALSAMSTQPAHVNALALRLMPTFKSKPLKRRLEFDLYVAQATGIAEGSAAAVAGILFGESISAGAIAITFGPAPGSGASLAAAYVEPSAGSGVPNFKSQPFTGAFPSLGSWATRMALEIDYGSDAGADTACVQVYLGIAAQLSPCLPLPQDLIQGQSLYVALGDLSVGLDTSTGSVDLAFDNVTYTQL